MIDLNRCDGMHELYVAECVGVESEGKIIVITVCRHCDKVSFHEHIVSASRAPIRLMKEEKFTKAEGNK